MVFWYLLLSVRPFKAFALISTAKRQTSKRVEEMINHKLILDSFTSFLFLVLFVFNCLQWFFIAFSLTGSCCNLRINPRENLKPKNCFYPKLCNLLTMKWWIQGESPATSTHANHKLRIDVGLGQQATQGTRRN